MTDVECLLAYAENNMNASDAARSIFCSRTSMIYHLDKVLRETGLNPYNFYDLCKLLKTNTERSCTMDKIKKHREICEQLNIIYTKKNHDYGDSFGNTFCKLGIISAITRITDKYNRLCSLCTKPQMVKDETIEDTLVDMANYCIMTLIELRAKKDISPSSDK